MSHSLSYKLGSKDKYHLFSSVVLIGITGVIAIPILARLLTVAAFGHVALLMLLFNAVGTLEILQPIIVRHYHKKHSEQQLNQFISTLLVMTIILGLIASTLLSAIVYKLFDILSFAEVFCFWIGINTNLIGSFFAGIMMANQQPGLVQLQRSVLWVLVYFSFVLFAYYDLEPLYYAIALCVMCSIQMLMYSYCAGVKPLLETFCLFQLRQCINQSKDIATFNGYRAIIDYFDRLVVAKFLPLPVFGIYSLHAELSLKGNLLAQSIARFLFPELCLMRSTHSDEFVYRYFSSLMAKTLSLIFFLTYSIAAFSHIIILVYAGEQYAHFSSLMIILLLGIFYNANSFLGISFQRAFDDFKSQKKCYLTAILLSLVAVYPLCHYFGIHGAAITFVILRFSSLGVGWNVIRHYCDSLDQLNYLLGICLSSSAFILLYFHPPVAHIMFVSALTFWLYLAYKKPLLFRAPVS